MDDYYNPASYLLHNSYSYAKRAREEEQKTIIKYVAVTEEELERIKEEEAEQERLAQLAIAEGIEERKALMAEDLRIYQEAKKNRKEKWKGFFAGDISITELYPQLNSYNLRAGIALSLVGGLLYFL